MGAKFTSWYIPRQYHLAISRLRNATDDESMEPREIRRRRVLELINLRFKGKKAPFARAIGYTPQVVGRWFVRTRHGRKINDEVAREIEATLGLPKWCLDSDKPLDEQTLRGIPRVEQELALYHISGDEQAQILSLFDKLSSTQRQAFIEQISAAVRANEVIVREVGPRFHPPPDDYVGKFLPKAPETSIRTDEPRG